MRRERWRANRRQGPPSEPPKRTEPVAASQTETGLVRLIAIASIAGSVVLFLICQYLTARFDVGSPVTHYVDPYLAIEISLMAVAATSVFWIVAIWEHRSPSDQSSASPRRHRPHGGSIPSKEGRGR